MEDNATGHTKALSSEGSELLCDKKEKLMSRLSRMLPTNDGLFL